MMRQITFPIRLVAGLALALPMCVSGFAQTGTPSAREPADCDCRASGTTWQQGKELCLGGTLRVCGMDQNVSAWIETKKPCPEAGFDGLVRRVAYAELAACFSSPRSP